MDMSLSPEQASEQARWIKIFEQSWGCKLTIEPKQKMVNIDDIDVEKVGACPICDHPIIEDQASVIGCINGFQSLIHERCSENMT
jgi:hypothetical protein